MMVARDGLIGLAFTLKIANNSTLIALEAVPTKFYFNNYQNQSLFMIIECKKEKVNYAVRVVYTFAMTLF